MNETSAGETTQAIDVQTTVLRIRFVATMPRDGEALMAFKDPAPGYAIVAGHAGSGDVAETDGSFDVVLLPPNAPQAAEGWPGGDAAPTIFVKYRGVELTWRAGHATLQCDAGQVDALLPALVEFAHFEGELRRIEVEVAAGWTELEQDKALAFEVTPGDLTRSAITAERMNRAFGRRIRYARVEPHLYEPDAALSAAGQKLGVELREKARIESRLETVDAQLEVYEHVYEMSSQRLGEYRASREEHRLEWIIIVLLAAELLALVAQMVWQLRR